MNLQNDNYCADLIELEGMRFDACHGCMPEEKTTPQPFAVDAVLFLPLEKAGTTDDIAHTIDYTAVFAETAKIVNGESVDLIETLAQKIAETLLEKFPLVQRVRITVHKPHSPLMENLTDVKTTVERSRKCEIVT